MQQAAKSFVDPETIVRWGLVLEAIACLWLARRAWSEAVHESLAVRLAAPALALAAAAVILYAAVR